tara:strand:- start:20510 stop:23197 length:2688 start_codon:yes stop_codon:yes gene_type:complete
MAKKKSKKMNINPKYLSGSKNPGRRAQLIRQIADIYKKGKPYPSNLNALMKERDKLQAGGNPYAMPTSAATSGYTSTMSGMAGAQQAAMQLAQIEQEVMATQQRRSQAEKEREVQQQQQFQQSMQQGAGELADDLGKNAIQQAANAARMAKIAKGTASARQVAKASKDTGQLLSNLGSYGKGAKDAASAAGSAAGSIGAGPIAAAASLAGKGVERLSDDDDDTRTNFGEGTGRLLSGAGSGVGLAAMVGLGPIGLIGAGLVGGTAALLRQRKQKLQAREEEARQQSQDAQMAAAEDAAFKQSMLSTGQDMGYNIGNSMTNSYLPGYQMQGGGLWANIRAKKARGEKMRSKGEKGAPTEAQMQRAKAQEGGYMKPLPGGAVEFVGPKHSQGGIMLDPQTEVEGGETMDKVKMRENGGKAGDYIFSDFLKLGKKTFAQRHKEMLSRGASQTDIQKLAKMQEEVAKREGRDENGPRGEEQIMQEGGFTVQEETTGVMPANIEDLEGYELDAEGAYARDFPEGQSRTEEGLYRRTDGDEVTMTQVDQLKANNPWYEDWDNFDPTNPESVEAFQKAYNERVPESAQIKVDGKVGEQTVSAYIPYKRQEEATIEGETPNQEMAEEVVEDTPVGPGMNLRRDILLPYQLMGPLAELTSKYPQPNTVAAPVTGRIKMPRMNMNAERAALSASTNAANKFIQNQSAGPAAIAAQMAMNEKQRAGNIEIANQEARANTQAAAQEEIGNLRASQFDAANVARARQFNAMSQNQRDQNEYEKRMLAFNQLGTNLAQYANDLRAYKAEDRVAEASQISGEYTRQKYLEQLRRQSRRRNSPYSGMNDTQLREVAAQMVAGAPTAALQDQQRVGAVVEAANAVTQDETTQQKRGGYIKKMGKVKRKRRKK